MGTWMETACDVLTVAAATVITEPDDSAPGVTLGDLVARQFIAPGPEFARDCSLLAVHVDSIEAVGLAAAETDLGMAGCVIVPAINLVVTLALDCVPTVSGNPPKPPPADDVTVWSLDFYDKATALWQALGDLAISGLEGCGDVSVGQAVTAGPQGGMAQVQVPVRVRLES